jgi:hypothetical protein
MKLHQICTQVPLVYIFSIQMKIKQGAQINNEERKEESKTKSDKNK